MNKKIVNNTVRVKQANIDLVRDALRDVKSATRSTISSMTGLSVATCGNILNEMLKTGEIFEAELEESKGGRPARSYRYNKNFSLFIAMAIVADMGKKILYYQVCNIFGESIAQDLLEYEYITYDTIEQLIEELIHEHNNIKAIGIGIPGVTSTEGNIISCDIPELENVPLCSKLTAKYKQQIVVENETHSVAYGFYNGLDNKTEHNCFAVLIAPEGYHLGVGTIANGEVLRGYRHLAGEVSLIPKEITREKMLAEMKVCEEKLIKAIVDAITSIIAIINPSIVVLTGSAIKKDMVPKILNKCSEKIDQIFLPTFEYKEEDYSGYIEGVKALTMEKLDNRVMLIQR